MFRFALSAVCSLITLSSLTPSASAALRFREVVPGEAALAATAYGGGQFVAVGRGVALTSPDSRNWSAHAIGTNLMLKAIAYGDGKYAAIGNQQINAGVWIAAVSTNGVNWVTNSPGKGAILNAMAYGQGGFVTVGYGGTILTSRDGLEWANHRTNVSWGLRAVTFANGLFVAVGNTGADSLIITSADGENWTVAFSAPGFGANGVAYGNGQFLVTGTGPGAAVSADGINWRYLPVASSHGWALAYGNDEFVALNSTTASTSADGTTWITGQLPWQLFVSSASIAFGAGQFAAVLSGGDSPNSSLLTSSEGVHWTAIGGSGLGLADQPGMGHRIAFGNGRFTLAGARIGPEEVSAVASSPDGLAWTLAETGSPEQMTSIAFAAERFVTLGFGSLDLSQDAQDWTAFTTPGLPMCTVSSANGLFFALGTAGTMRVSRNGYLWSAPDSGTTNTLTVATFGAGQFVAVGAGGTIITSTDAVNWTNRRSGFNGALHAATYGNGLFVVGGDAGALLTSRDAINWSQASSGPDAIFDLAFGNDTFVAVGARGILASDDGVTWLPTTPRATGPYYSVAYGNGKFLVQGRSLLEADVTEPVLTAAGSAIDGLSLLVSGLKGSSYRIQATPDLVNPSWSDVGAVTNTRATVSFSPPISFRSDHEFFRATALTP